MDGSTAATPPVSSLLSTYGNRLPRRHGGLGEETTRNGRARSCRCAWVPLAVPLPVLRQPLLNRSRLAAQNVQEVRFIHRPLQTWTRTLAEALPVAPERRNTLHKLPTASRGRSLECRRDRAAVKRSTCLWLRCVAIPLASYTPWRT